ncbi:MAG: A/G-specific adenine glycosylase [Chthoniobacteraceae bacterium]
MSAIQNPKLFRDSLIRWFKKNGRSLPWRDTHDPYAIWISEIMLQQTQVITVLDYYRRWMKRFPDFPTLAAASEADVLGLWQGLGYYSRARNIHFAARAVMKEHDGKMPASLVEIRKLPGIGRYTAGAISTFAYDKPEPIVDANIARVIARLFNLRIPIDSTAGQSALWSEAADLQPKANARLYNSALMELGALICLPRSPKCTVCPVQKHCTAVDPETLPVKKPRRKTVELAEHAAWIVKGGRILLQQQTGVRWRGLWKLPVFNLAPGMDQQFAPTPLLRFTYPFTHHRVMLAIFAQTAPDTLVDCQSWFKIKELEQLAMTAPHRRAVEQLLAAKITGSIKTLSDD